MKIKLMLVPQLTYCLLLHQLTYCSEGAADFTVMMMMIIMMMIMTIVSVEQRPGLGEHV
jgi:hypothetical protein